MFRFLLWRYKTHRTMLLIIHDSPSLQIMNNALVNDAKKCIVITHMVEGLRQQCAQPQFGKYLHS